MRIPTFNLFQQQLYSMQQQNISLNYLYQQAESHKSILSPSDDPVLASRITLTSNYIDNLASYSQNNTLATNRMKEFDTSIKSAVSYMSQVNTLIESAQNGTNTDAGRNAIALQLQGYLNNMLNVANTQDSSGSYIFSGSYTNVPPYVLQGGSYQYQGSFDTTSIDIGPNTSVIFNDVGYNVFGNLSLGNGTFAITANSANKGSAYTTPGSVTDQSAYVADTYSISFTTNPATGKLVYSVTGAASGQVIPPPPGTIPDDAPEFTSSANGANISFNGMSININGEPQAGDSFQVAPSQKQDMFDTLQSLITALQTPTGGDPAKLAQLQQIMSQASAFFQSANSNVISYNSEIGTRMSAVNDESHMIQNSISNESDILIKLAVADPYEVITQITQQEQYLKASVDIFRQMQDVLMSILKM